MRLCAVPFGMLAVIVLVAVNAGGLRAQKSEKQVQDEYRKNITNYIQDLDDNFAIRYVYEEQYLLDLITFVYNEVVFRKQNNIPRSGGTGTKGLMARDQREALRNRLAENVKLLRDMKKANRLMAGYNSRAAINELHQKYQKLYAEDLELSKLEALGMRKSLLEVGQAGDARRMFESQLATALRRYKEESFPTAALELKDLYETYKTHVNEWDDILYFLADSYFRTSDFEMAEKYFAKVTADFPASPYAGKASFRLISMAYIEGNRTKMVKYFGDYESRGAKPSDDRWFNKAVFMAATTFFRNSDYTSAISALEKIPSTSLYYYPARYLMANCYAGQESYSAALEAFGLVVKWPHKVKRFDRDIQRKLRHMSMLKSGMIQYEQNVNGLKFRNVYPECRRIPKDSEYQDAGLLVSAWAAFKDNNVDTARILVDSLIRNFPASDHIFEAKTLIGNIEVLDPRLSDKDRELLAIDAYEYVARAMEAKYLADRFIVERDSVVRIMDQLAQARTIAGLRGDSIAYLKYDGIHQILEISLVNNGFTKAVKEDSRSVKFYQTVSNLISEVRVTEGKLKSAQESGNTKEAEALQKKLDETLTKLQEMGGERYISIVLPGMASGESNDVESVLAMRNDAIDKVRQKVKTEKNQIEARLAEADRLIEKARQKNSQRDVERLEAQKAKLNEAYTQVVDYERWANNLETVDPKSVSGQQTSNTSVLGEEFTGVTLDNYSNIEIQNYFTLHKMSRVISEIEARNRSLNLLRDKMAREKDLVRKQIGKVDAMMAEARNKGAQNALLKLQFERNKLVDLHGRISEYEISLLSQDQVESYADLDVWGDFAIYGRNNITYVINTTKIETINDLSRAISQIDRILLNRKKNYEHRIAMIEEDIKRKEQEIRDKELQEIRASQKQYYEREFFQSKTSEKPEEDPYDYVNLVPEVVDIKAIEDSLKKLEVPIIEKPSEEEVYEDSGLPADSVGVSGSGESSGGTETGSGIGAGAGTTINTDVDTGAAKKDDGAAAEKDVVPTDTKSEIPLDSGTEIKSESTADSVSTDTSTPADTSGQSDEGGQKEEGGGGEFGSTIRLPRPRMDLGIATMIANARDGLARMNRRVTTMKNC